MLQEPTQERAESSFNVRFLTVDGKPLTVIGSIDAIASLEQRLENAAASQPADDGNEAAPSTFPS